MPCSNASSASVCVDAKQSVVLDDVKNLASQKCDPIPELGHFEDLSKDPDISKRCTVAPEVVLVSFTYI